MPWCAPCSTDDLRPRQRTSRAQVTFREARSIECMAEKASDRSILADALARLPADQRTVLFRAHYLGQSVADIAALERVSADTVKLLLHHALYALRMPVQERRAG
ncbi:hypothetical protein DVS77_02600 [Mycolicibacterium moriokaense]|nr:hypothetical protein DVS77_02600 [Mycolicibacterium moriokaense]